MLLDCTFRDGGYYTNWTFDKDMVRETVRALDNTDRFEYIELGYKSPSKGGPYKKCNEKYIKAVLQNKPNTKLAFMIDLKEFYNVVLGGLDKQLVNDIIPHSKDSWFSLARVALTKANLSILPDMVKILKQKKYTVGVNLMQVDLLEEQEFIRAVEELRLIKNSIDYFYVADSFGTIKPQKLEYYKSHYSTLGKIGFHAHDNMGLAFANVLEAERLEYDLIDTTMTGMGRGVGNARTEQYLMLDKGFHQEVFDVVDKWFVPLQRKCKWGWNRHYMQTARYKTHPSYAQRLLNSHLSDGQITDVLSGLYEAAYKERDISDLVTPRTCIVIPARYQSSRFPGKPLQPIFGEPMISYVASTAIEVVGREHVYIATENNEIRLVCKELGYNVIMTSDQCLTGTDRVAEAAMELDYDHFVNIQGDEPMLKEQDIRKAIYAKNKHHDKVVNCYTSVYENEAANPNTIKMVMKKNSDLMYASRSTIPGTKTGIGDRLHKQVCIYVFNKRELEMFSSRDKTPVEWYEDIEILRFLEMNYPVHMVRVSASSHAVDTPEDIKTVEELML